VEGDVGTVYHHRSDEIEVVFRLEGGRRLSVTMDRNEAEAIRRAIAGALDEPAGDATTRLL
jgi:hypothetical protein